MLLRSLTVKKNNQIYFYKKFIITLNLQLSSNSFVSQFGGLAFNSKQACLRLLPCFQLTLVPNDKVFCQHPKAPPPAPPIPIQVPSTYLHASDDQNIIYYIKSKFKVEFNIAQWKLKRYSSSSCCDNIPQATASHRIKLYLTDVMIVQNLQQFDCEEIVEPMHYSTYCKLSKIYLYSRLSIRAAEDLWGSKNLYNKTLCVCTTDSSVVVFFVLVGGSCSFIVQIFSHAGIKRNYW